MIIKSNLLILMQTHKYNMKSLSLTAGLNETAIRDIVKGKVLNPRINTLQRIAKVLNCSINDLVDDRSIEDS